MDVCARGEGGLRARVVLEGKQHKQKGGSNTTHRVGGACALNEEALKGAPEYRFVYADRARKCRLYIY